jgi:hypothetical protein
VAPGLRRACRPTNAEKAELAEALSRGESPLDESEPEIAALGRKVGEQAMALDIFREALPHVREKRRLSGVSGETDPTT